MSTISIKYRDKQVQLPAGSTAEELAKQLHLTAPDQAVAAHINGMTVDLSQSLKDGDEVQFWNFSDREGKEVYWHSSAHILAQAILRLWPQAKPTIGPPIENGFYYDFAEMEWSILQQDTPDDFVIATGKHHSVKEFVNLAATELGLCLRWEGTGLQEKGILHSIKAHSFYRAHERLKPGMAIVKIDPQFFRPADVEDLLGDPSKAYKTLNWKPKISFQELVIEMTREDYLLAQQETGIAQSEFTKL